MGIICRQFSVFVSVAGLQIKSVSADLSCQVVKNTLCILSVRQSVLIDVIRIEDGRIEFLSSKSEESADMYRKFLKIKIK